MREDRPFIFTDIKHNHNVSLVIDWIRVNVLFEDLLHA